MAGHPGGLLGLSWQKEVAGRHGPEEGWPRIALAMLHSLVGENRLGTDRDQGVLGVPAHDLPRVSVQSSGQLWVNRTWSARRGRCAFLRLQYYFQAALQPVVGL